MIRYYNQMKDKKVHKGWRTTAIIFIVLFILSISYIVWGVSLYLKDVKLNDKCAIEICGYSIYEEDYIGEYDGYYYDEYYKTCSCFIGNDIMKEVVIK